MSSHPLPRWRSLRLRLPLLISTLVIIVIGAFLWATNRELEQALRRAGSDRAQAAADQMSALMTQAVTRGVNEARRIAGGEAVRQYLLDPSDDRQPAEQALLPLAAAAQPPVELWTEAGTRVLQVSSPRGKPAADAVRWCCGPGSVRSASHTMRWSTD